MTSDIGAAPQSRLNPDHLDQTDRILLGVCAALWLLALGAGVAAVVALTNLGSRAPGADGDTETPWLLYTVIGVSAVVIIAAVPLLIRARRASAEVDPAPGTPAAGTPARTERPGAAFGDPVETSNLRGAAVPVIRRQPQPPASSRIGFPTAAVEQIMLRCPVIIASAVGGATALIGIATYLLATDHESASWVAYGLAGLVTVAMPVVPVLFLRRLRAVLA
ncbi:DUF2561 family protein [Mycolicibacterium sediminis]|uniref:DUF2561 domain-containing protein n=1 Tax=Mycolicibacterium sediminis TaxID=1286180 RepID=A0A7I7QX43_9MYCO|nr:DUF2561 family protein [Mycolicibacterium sediminis]BBY30567.1 hypothetical protein MSEDJ_46630 [Mycolicibacterium sediminis]